MNTLEEIRLSLDIIHDLFNSNRNYITILNLLRKKTQNLSVEEHRILCENYNYESFISLLPYIDHTFDFYSKNKVQLSTTIQQSLIIKYIENFSQIANTLEYPFINLGSEESKYDQTR